VTQSVELLLDEAAERAIREEWAALHEARLPTEQRSSAPAAAETSHRPHITLYAGESISRETDAGLSAVVSGLDLTVRLGALTLFGPHRDRYVLVHQVVASTELLELQRRVVTLCGAGSPHFAPGGWTPHVTLARRLGAQQLAEVLEVLAGLEVVGTSARVRRARRWDGDARESWLL
jgi:2'-5' RNA ligase